MPRDERTGIHKKYTKLRSIYESQARSLVGRHRRSAQIWFSQISAAAGEGTNVAAARARSATGGIGTGMGWAAALSRGGAGWRTRWIGEGYDRWGPLGSDVEREQQRGILVHTKIH